MIELPKTFQSPKYEFLNTNSDLNNIIYLTSSGSYGYGTNHENSDIDLRGVVVEDDRYLFGLSSFEQFEDIETDTVIFGLKKFIKLCVEANPNALELLGTEEEAIVTMTESGRLLRDNAHLFLSKRVIQSFGNYATAQLRRLQNALCHDQYKESEQEKHLMNTLVAQMDHFKRTYTNFDRGAITLAVSEETKELTMDIKLNGYPLRDFVGIFGEMSNVVKAYNKLNHRNRKKDEPHLYKHAMHLIRLLITGIDILNGKGIITKRTIEHEFLMDLRNGRYSFDEIFGFADEYQARFTDAASMTALPEKVDMVTIERLMRQIYN